jgi:NADP-dependent 3-hydroxy acid dehydrogenase YdfG
MNSLEGKVALVTGASRGIGRSVAKALSAEGVSLGLASRSGDDLGLPNVVSLPCDVRHQHEVQAIVDATIERFGRLDILVPNAGVAAGGPFLDISSDHLEEMIDVNLKGSIYAVRCALPHLIDAGESDIVAVASVSGLRGQPFEAIYAASKFGQIGMMRSLDHELRQKGVRCTSVCPGAVATDLAMGDGRGRTPGMPELATMMTPEDVAEIILFVLTRPRNHRILEVATRPVAEASWG